MSRNYKWGNHEAGKKIYVGLFVSRNKDNKYLDGFKERIYTDKDVDRVKDEFENYVRRGVEGEFRRFYHSVNRRDEKMIRKYLLEQLIFDDTISVVRLDPVLAGIAAKKECAATAHWMFDFDSLDEDKLNEFISDVEEYSNEAFVDYKPTPHGYAVIIEHGFDTRELMKKWSDIVELKRDDMLCTSWEITKNSWQN